MGLGDQHKFQGVIILTLICVLHFMEEEDIFGVEEDGVLTVRDLWRCLFKLIDVILQKSKQLDMMNLVSYCRWRGVGVY